MIYKFKPFMGPAQYVFKDPDTGLQYKEKSKKTLIDRILAYRNQNGLPELEFLDDVLESYWCGLPENTGRCVPKALKLGILPSIRGGIAVLKNYMYSVFAPQEVAEKRADHCSTCKYNQMPETEGVKAWLDVVAINSVAGRRTKKYDKLGTCSVCDCALNMKVFYSGTIEAPTPEQMKKYEEVNCWQLGIIK